LERFREDHLGYNHLAFNMVALLCWNSAVAKSVPPEFECQLISILAEQILSDGGHAERTPGYHVHVLSMVRLARLARGLSSEARERLTDFVKQMTAALEGLTHPDGDVAIFNDTSLGDAPPAQVFLSKGGQRDLPSAFVLPAMGIAKLSAFDNCVLMDAGPQMRGEYPGHGHSGYLTCEISWCGRRFVIDPGVASYEAGRARDWTRSGTTHNGPHSLQGEAMQFAEAFDVGRYSVSRVKLLREIGNSNSQGFMGGYTPYFSEKQIVRIVAQETTTGGILIVDYWEDTQAACDSNFLIEPSWNLVGDFDANTVSFRQNEADDLLVFQVLDGSLTRDADCDVYPFGPAVPIAARRLIVSPTMLGAKAVRVIAIGTADDVRSMYLLKSRLFCDGWLDQVIGSVKTDQMFSVSA